MDLAEEQGVVSMTEEARLRWTALGDRSRQPAVVLLSGGPGLPDYLVDVAAMVADLAPVYRYDQRGTGQSPWRGPHTFARHVDDLAELLDEWGVPEAVVIGHSYGTDLASRFCLTHPDRVAAMLLMCGPFVGDWRGGDRAELRAGGALVGLEVCREHAAQPVEFSRCGIRPGARALCSSRGIAGACGSAASLGRRGRRRL
ncbi:alpha/beta fold hydrolase [Streptomyces sp. NPDC091265]|uniref:alpha/beta fold hydrolase n=1 Tax=unclassified Streptomyces TaxID=2593676 RepID=UPI00344FA52B